MTKGHKILCLILKEASKVFRPITHSRLATMKMWTMITHPRPSYEKPTPGHSGPLNEDLNIPANQRFTSIMGRVHVGAGRNMFCNNLDINNLGRVISNGNVIVSGLGFQTVTNREGGNRSCNPSFVGRKGCDRRSDGFQGLRQKEYTPKRRDGRCPEDAQFRGTNHLNRMSMF